MKTVSALFDSSTDARHAVKALADAGLSSDRISYVARTGDSAVERQGIGRAGGTVAGATGGALAGLAIVAIPGVGPAVAAGALLAGGLAGGLIGNLVGHGIDEDDAHIFAEGLRRGGAVVTAHADDRQREIVEAILQNSGAVDISERRTEYRSGGWRGFDESAGVWDVEDMEEERQRHGEPRVVIPIPPTRV